MMNLKPNVDLNVFVVFPNGEVVKAGRILSLNLDTFKKEGYFRYVPAYLAHKQAFPIDPAHLPLSDKSFAARDAQDEDAELHFTFADSLPDSWGLQLLAGKGMVDLVNCSKAHLLSILGSSGLGGLLFSEKDKLPQIEDNSLPFSDIFQALDESAIMEKQDGFNIEELRHILASGSSAGGARPKVLTFFENHHWIAKLSSIKDNPQKLNVTLEQAGMILAGQAGLDIPHIKRVSIRGREILLVKRFDVTPQGGRNAMLSFKSLLGTTDPSLVSYGKMAEILKKHSGCPKRDLELLFRQMIVNVVLKNGDDHLQNFSMIHTGQGWELSPAYDIVPNIHQSGLLIPINGKHLEIGIEDIVVEGGRFGFSPTKARTILDETTHKLSNWKDVFEECGVPIEQTGQLRENITAAFFQLQEQP